MQSPNTPPGGTLFTAAHRNVDQNCTGRDGGRIDRGRDCKRGNLTQYPPGLPTTTLQPPTCLHSFPLIFLCIPPVSLWPPPASRDSSLWWWRIRMKYWNRQFCLLIYTTLSSLSLSLCLSFFPPSFYFCPLSRSLAHSFFLSLFLPPSLSLILTLFLSLSFCEYSRWALRWISYSLSHAHTLGL